jgi:hypothetical protein
MQYQISLQVPPLTSAANPVVGVQLLDVGTLDSIDVRFPAGCCSLVHFAAKMREVQLVPWNQDGFISSNDHVVHSSLDTILDQPPMEVYCLGWSDDDTYPHTLLVLINWTPKGAPTIAQLLLEGA